MSLSSAVLLILLVMTPAADSPDILKDYRWEKRVLLLFRNDGNHSVYNEQRTLLGQKPASRALEDRDVVVLLCAGTDRYPELRTRFRVQPKGFTAVLIGKDGEEKWRKTELFKVDELIRLIDAMPMGREEKEKRGRTQN